MHVNQLHINKLYCTVLVYTMVTYEASNITFHESKNSCNQENDLATYPVAICPAVVERSVKSGLGHWMPVLALQHPAPQNSKFFIKSMQNKVHTKVQCTRSAPKALNTPSCEWLSIKIVPGFLIPLLTNCVIKLHCPI